MTNRFRRYENGYTDLFWIIVFRYWYIVDPEGGLKCDVKYGYWQYGLLCHFVKRWNDENHEEKQITTIG